MKYLHKFLLFLLFGLTSIYAAAPVITSTAITSGAKDTLYNYELNATDADGDTLSWSVTNGTTLPNWLTLSNAFDWNTTGVADFSAGGAYNTSIAIDSNNVAYVVYSDSANSNKATVMKYYDSNNSWGAVGSAGFSAGTTDYTSIAIDSNNVPYVVYQDGVNGNKATVMKYYDSNNSWGAVGGAGISAGQALQNAIAIDRNNTIYLFYRDDGNSGDATVKKFDGTSWVVVGNTGFNAGTIEYNNIAIDSNNAPYVVYKDDGNSGKVTVKKFNGTSWVDVGSAGFSAGGVYNTSIAIDSNNVPYVVYADGANSSKATVMKYYDSNNSWGAVGTAGFSTADAYNATIAIDSNNVPYVVYRDGSPADPMGGPPATGAGGKATVKKFDGTNWVDVGTADFSTGVANYTSIAIDSNNVAYVVYADGANSSKATVNNFSKAKLTGTPTASNGATSTQDVNLTVSDGNGGTATQNFTITLSGFNNPTTFSSLSSINTTDKAGAVSPFSSLTLTDSDSTSFDANISLDDNAKGTLSATSFSGKTLSELQTALQALTFTPTQNRVAPDANETTTITLTISADGNDATTTNTVVTTSVNDAPVVQSTAITSGTKDTLYSYELNATDADANANLTWSVTSGTSLPSWLSLSKSLSSSIVTTLAGSGSYGSTDATGTAASFAYPNGIVEDSSGNIYVADTVNNKIRKITPAGVVTTFVGSTTSGSADGNGTAASFNQPSGMAIDSNDNIYVADTRNGKIRKITPAGVVSTLSGDFPLEQTIGATIGMQDVAVDNNGNVYVAYTGKNKIDKITSEGVVSTFAGSGSYGSTDGNGTDASFAKPYAIAVDSHGNVYVSETNTNKIRKITPAGVVTTFAGSSTSGSIDATGTAASFSSPRGITIDSSDNIYVADSGNNKIRKITQAGVVTTIAGSGTSGSTDGTGTDASFNSPYNLTVDSNGNIYVSDTFSQKIRKIAPAATKLTGTPTSSDIGTHTISLTVSDSNGGKATQNFQITVRTPAANTAMEKIAAYATDSTQTTPTVQDYTDAGITGVNATNLTQVNTEVAKKDATGVDTEVKIQTLVASVTGVSGGNHAPVIDTVFNDRTIAENALSFQVDVNISDKDGDDLNLTVESDNTALLQVTQNYTNLLNQAAYNGVTLDFNLTSQTDANGVAQITLSLNDGTATTTKTFKVTVTPIVALSQMSDVVVYKNSGDANITLHTSNAQNNVYTYSAQAVDTTLVSHISFDGDIMIITPAKGVSGTTDINITVKDSNNVSSSKVLKFIILPLEKNSNFSQQAQTTTTTSDGNSTSIDLTGLSGKITTDTNGTVEHIMTIGDINTTSRSELAGSVVAFTSTGVHTTYSDTNLSIEVNATMTGKAIHELTVGGVTTKAVSEFLGASTIIGKDANGSVEITTSVKPNANTSISVVAKADGTAQYKVKVNGVKTVATSELKGASTIIDSNANVTTTQNDSAKDETVNGDTWKFEAVIKTDAQGRTVTVFERKNSATGALKDVQDTFKPSTPYDPGNKVTIGDIGGVLYFQIKTSVTYDLVVK